MFQFLRQCFIAIKEAFLDSIRTGRDPIHQYPQEQERQRIINHAEDPTWTAEEVFEEFLIYIVRYDPERRLTRTRELLEIILEHRREIWNEALRKRIINRLTTRR